jgi:hypothetical protein
MKTRSAIGHVLRADFPAMSFYNRVHNCQSHSQPMLFGGEEMVEQPVVRSQGNAGAMIAHA